MDGTARWQLAWPWRRLVGKVVVGLWITNLETTAQLEPRYSKGLEAGVLRSKHSGVWEEREEGSKKVYRYFIFSKLLVVLVLGTERVELEVRCDRICFV